MIQLKKKLALNMKLEIIVNEITERTVMQTLLYSEK
mgnify:CR=1 FL=1